ncbi:MAG: peptidoglycan DD-metalloendopeptidase family protein [Propionibacteriales bacterium]|nr:peptidoglycan DD-metalloendopeptidase family protein [Propionibacteriales bacterium]
MALISVLAVTLALGTPARADDLDDQKDEVNKKIAETRKQLNESSGELSDAVVALEKSQAELSAAQTALDQTRVEEAKAADYDRRMAEKLRLAQAQLDKAKKDVAAGLVKLAEQKRVVGQVAQVQYQQRTNLMGVAMLSENGSMHDLQTRVQYSTTLFDVTESKMKDLEAAQRDLDAKKAKQAEIEKQIAIDRQAAADNLDRKAALALQAEQQTASVATLVAANSTAKDAAAKAVAADKDRYAELNTERSSVERRIKQRIADQKAAEARRVAAEQKAARQQAARSQKKSSRSAPAQSSPQRRSSSSGSSSSGGSSNGKFMFPVNGPITSPYGMRLHPILKYWKLHDGTDFAANCGVTIRAAYDGTVSERYFNTGYGNRLLIDHGNVRGQQVTTAYNHAMRYTVRVGQKVKKGQAIGYVGTTGYSTGCHMHVMVYLDGNLSNPMSYF